MNTFAQLLRDYPALLLVGAGSGALATTVKGTLTTGGDTPGQAHTITDHVPSRASCVNRLQEPGRVFDVLIIGGGATGTGCAVDAATRCADRFLRHKQVVTHATQQLTQNFQHDVGLGWGEGGSGTRGWLRAVRQVAQHSALTACCPCAHALSRGLRTALVEREDFASGTSSKSTKLVHGGVRYLVRGTWSSCGHHMM